MLIMLRGGATAYGSLLFCPSLLALANGINLSASECVYVCKVIFLETLICQIFDLKLCFQVMT